ncbi:MAG: DUF1772 domain-containing protein [Caldilinea sp. CFX5]|nr:DUF1772 domain-containing protein [Caldilinea sp. CFX5]
MIEFLQLLAVFLVAVAFALALAHALELPGKMRLSREVYYAVQPIYYPGFTIGGISEPVGLLLTLLLLWLTPWGSPDFWLTLLALAGLVGMQAVYWFVTHPVNKFWLQDEALRGVSAGFFALGRAEKRALPWTALRNRWEYSHVARAAFAFVSLLAFILLIRR